MFFKTKEDLNRALLTNKKELIIRSFWIESEKQKLLDTFKEGLREKYDSLYPTIDDTNGDLIKYVTIVSKEMNEDTLLEEVVYEDFAYILIEGDDGETIKTLSPESKALIDEGKVRPTYDAFKEEEVEKYLDVIVNHFNEIKYIEFIKPVLKDRISKLADEKSDLAEAYLAGKESISLKQVERYKRKYDLAVKCKAANDFAILDTEASLVGITGAELADLIIAQGDAWNIALNNFYALIEAYRVRANAIADAITTLDEVSLAFKLLEESKSFNADTTPADVEAVFANF